LSIATPEFFSDKNCFFGARQLFWCSMAPDYEKMAYDFSFSADIILFSFQLS